MNSFDVVVIGGGPGGYVAAIRCAQLGLRTACVDDWRNEDGKPALGGTCLNVGCIPSKALLDASHHYAHLQHLPAHGITASGVQLDVGVMQARKQKVVRTLTGGIEALFLKHKITWLRGRGRLIGEQQVEVRDRDGATQTVQGKHLIIATGSVPAPLAQIPFDGDRIVDSTGALAFTEVPKRLAVIGGGVIGLELGSVWRRLGSEVTVLNRGKTLLSKVDEDVAKEAHRQLSAQGLGVRLALDEQCFIVVDECCRTALSNVYAIGDVVRGPMLAHKASEEGVMVAEHIAGQAGHVNYETIPWVIYTWPEIAWVGKTAQQLRNANRDFRAGVFPFIGNGRAQAMGDTAGLVKIVSDAKTDRVLGVHIIGPYASEMISEAVTVMEFGGAAVDIARTVHAHPTLTEAMHEEAHAVAGRALRFGRVLPLQRALRKPVAPARRYATGIHLLDTTGYRRWQNASSTQRAGRIEAKACTVDITA